MKKIISTSAILIFCISNFLFAQNPFESLGVKNVKVATLTNGKYNEFFDGDSIVQIGSILLNTNTNEIVAFVKVDTTYSEATLKPEITSRWLSPDALASKYPYISPYAYVDNNPIISIDPNGKEKLVVIGYGAGNYAQEFVNTGLALAQNYASHAQNGEATTVLVYANSAKDANYQYAVSQAKEMGLPAPTLVTSASDISNYVNNREAGDNPDVNLVTDFGYVGHSSRQQLYSGYGSGESYGALSGGDFNNSAFSDNSNANLIGCRTAASTDLSGRSDNEGNITDYFANRLVGGSATGAPYDVYFGQSNPNSNSAAKGSYYYQGSSSASGKAAGQASPVVMPGSGHIQPMKPIDVKEVRSSGAH